MRPIKRVLVALDGSREAEAILPVVTAIAEPYRLEIVLLRVIGGADSESRAAIAHQAQLVEQDAVAAEAAAYLDPLVERLARRGLRVQRRVRIGDPARQIVAAGRHLKADLIAMATHARRGLNRCLFGSVANEVVAHAGVPVLTVRASARTAVAHQPRVRSRSA